MRLLNEPQDEMCCCIQGRVTLGEGRGHKLQPSQACNGLLITNLLQETHPRDCITEAVVLALGEAILFFVRHLHNEGLLYCDAQDIECGLTGFCYLGRENCTEGIDSKHHTRRLQSHCRWCSREENEG